MQQVDSAIAAGTWPVVGPKLFTWGTNNNGQLGLGTVGAGTYKSSPTQVGSLANWLTVAAGRYSSLAIKTDGTLWTWGDNTGGQLGLGNTTKYSSPKQVGALTNWSKLSNGLFWSNGAIKSDGTLWMWGYGLYGTLGLGNTTSYSSPKQVGALTTWSYLSIGVFAVGAIKTDGTLWTWGGNQLSGVMGLGNLTYYSSPKQVGSLTNWLTVCLGQYSAVATKTDGTLWAWGKNVNGDLGLGNANTYSSPKQVGSLTVWATAQTSYSISGAIKTDGTLWMWGNNISGALGLGNTTQYSSPKQIGALTNWAKIQPGYAGTFTAALKTNGTLWTWGGSGYGQLGLGNNTYYSSPKQVGSLTTWTSMAASNNGVIAIATP